MDTSTLVQKSLFTYDFEPFLGTPVSKSISLDKHDDEVDSKTLSRLFKTFLTRLKICR